jgi:multidrug efflux pump
MHAIIDAAMDRSRTVLLLLMLIFIAGTASYLTIPKESKPDIQIPVIYVSIRLEGVAPEDSERLLIRPLEKRFSAIEGVKEMRSHAIEGNGTIYLEFNPGFDSAKALDDVREKIDDARPELPQDAEEPEVHEINLSLFPVISVILKATLPEQQMVFLARDLRDKIESLPQVLTANISGDREEALEVIIDPMVLQSYRLTPEETFALFQRNNALIPAGAMNRDQGSFSIKVPGVLEDTQDFLNLPVKTNGDAVVRLRDITTIRRGFKDSTGYVRVNGASALAIEVSKRTGENLIETVEAIRALVAKEQEFWPAGVEVVFAQDTSDKIKNRVSDLQNNIILAVYLVLVVLIAVMGVRPALLVALAVPGAFLFGILLLDFLGVTLNIVVLFSLILSIGMLVDAAIVVSEYADRKMQQGKKPYESYNIAAKRMAWPVIASTVTTLIVFLPLLFWPGIVGEFMKFMPLTLIMVLSGSLLMALIFLPTMGVMLARFAKQKDGYERPEASDARDMDDWDGNPSTLNGFTRRYVRLLEVALRHPGKVALSVVAVLVVIFSLYGVFGKGVEFFPDIEPQNLIVQVHGRGNLSVEQRDAILREVEARVLPIEDIRIAYASSKVRRSRDVAEDVIATISLELRDWRLRRKAKDVITDIYSRVADIPGVTVEVQKQKEGPGSGKPVQIELTSREWDALSPAVEQIRQGMGAVGGFIDIEDNRPIPAIEWNMRINRELASRFGADVQTAGAFMKLVSNGLIADTYRPDNADDEVDVVVRFPPEDRTISVLDRLRITTASGEIPLTNFVTRTPRPTISTIERLDQQRMMTVKADVAEGELVDERVKALGTWLRDQDAWDTRVQVSFGGEKEDQNEARNFLMTAFVLALFGMFIVMVTQFNSIYQTIVVMSAVFLSTAGVVLGLLVTDQPFGIVMCGVGVISLAGIVVNNNIIFIDSFQQHLRKGREVRDALIRTGAERLRPILLTAGTTVLGLLPMVLGMTVNFIDREIFFGAPSSQWWLQLSTAIAGGLVFATILTLFFTPSLLILGRRFHHWRQKSRFLPRLLPRFGTKPYRGKRTESGDMI